MLTIAGWQLVCGWLIVQRNSNSSIYTIYQDVLWGGTVRIVQDAGLSFPELLDWQYVDNSRSEGNQRDAVSKQQYEAHPQSPWQG